MIVTFGLTRAASFTSARRELPTRGRPGQCVAPDGGGKASSAPPDGKSTDRCATRRARVRPGRPTWQALVEYAAPHGRRAPLPAAHRRAADSSGRSGPGARPAPPALGAGGAASAAPSITGKIAEPLQSAGRYVPAERPRAGAATTEDMGPRRRPGHCGSPDGARASPPGDPAAGRPERSIPDGPACVADEDPPTLPSGLTAYPEAAAGRRAGRRPPRRNSRFAYAARLSRARDGQRTVPRRAGFCPRPAGARSRVCPWPRTSGGARGRLEGAAASDARLPTGTVPPKTQDEKGAWMLQRAPTLASLATNLGSAPLGSR